MFNQNSQHSQSLNMVFVNKVNCETDRVKFLNIFNNFKNNIGHIIFGQIVYSSRSDRSFYVSYPLSSLPPPPPTWANVTK